MNGSSRFACNMWCELPDRRADTKTSRQQKVIALLEAQPDLQLKNIQDFLQTEYDLKVTVSTISRQLSRANKARATRPGYKGKRPDLQPTTPPQQAQLPQLPQPPQPQPQPLADSYTGGASTAPVIQQQPQPTQRQAVVVVDDDDDDELESPATSHPIATHLMRLKCPYYACNPQRYASHPFCQSAWPTARDVKYAYTLSCVSLWGNIR